jgi:hypothetical protein
MPWGLIWQGGEMRQALQSLGGAMPINFQLTIRTRRSRLPRTPRFFLVSSAPGVCHAGIPRITAKTLGGPLPWNTFL